MQHLASFFTIALIRLFSLLPFGLLWPLADALAFLLHHVLSYRRKVVLQNLANSFPEKTAREIKIVAAKFYRHLADLMVESIKGLTLSKAALQSRYKYRNPEVFLPFFEKKQSIILLASHFGNWEWGVLSIPLVVRHNVVGIYKQLENKRLDLELNTLRKQWGLRLTDMAQAGRAIVRHRNEPTIFVFIADQTPIDVHNAHWLDFMRQDTPFLHGADKLARQTGYPVFYCEIERAARGFYEVTFTPICEANQPLAESEITRQYAARLEATIRKSPADWLWSHRRWKRKR